MKDKTFAYAAGILDGEGTLTISNSCYRDKTRPKQRSRNYTVVISVRNTDKRLMVWLKDKFGGNFYGKEWPSNPTHWKLSYRWQLFGRKAQEDFLLGVLPYIQLKREQATILLSFIRMNGEENQAKRNQMWLDIKSLNQRGKSPTTNTLHSETEKIESGLAGDSKSAPLVTATA